jgi:hypothetical protein
VPRKRRLQTLAVACWSVTIIVTTFIFLLLWCVSSSGITGNFVGTLMTAYIPQLDTTALAVNRDISHLDSLLRPESGTRWED